MGAPSSNGMTQLSEPAIAAVPLLLHRGGSFVELGWQVYNGKEKTQGERLALM